MTSSIEFKDEDECGPNYIPLTFDMLVKFRSNTVHALTADIEKAFLMVGIRKEHRDMLRFLWFSNPSESTPEVVQYRFNRLVFCLRPSPSILRATIKFHLEQYRQSEPELVKLIEKSLYVDDLVTGEITVEKAYAIYERSKKVMSEGGFNLRKWKTNSRDLRYKIAQEPTTFKVVIEDCVFRVRRVNVSSTVMIGHTEALNHTTAKYLVNRVECKVFSAPRGNYSENQPNIFQGQLPDRIVIGMVDSTAFNGSFKNNPFNFKNYDMTYLCKWGTFT